MDSVTAVTLTVLIAAVAPIIGMSLNLPCPAPLPWFGGWIVIAICASYVFG